MEITIHKEKISHFTFHGEKRADQESRKYPLVTTLFIHESLLSLMSFHRKLLAVQYRECENRLYCFPCSRRHCTPSAHALESVAA